MLTQTPKTGFASQTVKVNREEFLSALGQVQAGLAVGREIVEQSTCLAMVDGQLFTYNERTTCRAPSPLPKDFTGAVQFAPLFDVLNKLEEETIELEPTEGALVVKGKRKKSEIRMVKEIYLPVNKIEQPGEWQPLHDDFCDAIEMVQSCAGKNENRLACTCVHITPEWVEACDFDRACLCRWNIQTGFQGSALLRRESVQHVSKLGTMKFSETENWVHFKGARGFVLSCRRLVDVTEFPDLSRNLEIQGEPLNLVKRIVKALDLATVFTSPEGEDNDHVKIKLEPGKLILKGTGPQGSHTEWMKVKYSGKSIEFFIPPTMLRDIVENHSQCSVTDNALIVEGGRYKFITMLATQTEGNGNGQPVEETPVEEGDDE